MVTLETLAERHLVALARLAADPRVSRTSGVPPGCDLAAVRGWLAANRCVRPAAFTFTIVADGVAAGCAILKKIDWTAGHAELSYWLGAEFWRRGIAAEAAVALRDMAFAQHGFEYLHAHYLKDNCAASGRILEKLGFEADAAKPDAPVTGRFAALAPDVWTFRRLTRAAWRQAAEGAGACAPGQCGEALPGASLSFGSPSG